MRNLILPAIAIAFSAASPALASPSQCYNAYGRPIGPVYDTDNPNYDFINRVIARGGTCTGVTSRPGRRYYYDRDYRYDERYRYRDSDRYRDY